MPWREDRFSFPAKQCADTGVLQINRIIFSIEEYFGNTDTLEKKEKSPKKGGCQANCLPGIYYEKVI